MLFDRHRPHAFREVRVAPERAEEAAQAEQASVSARTAQHPALEAYAVHLAHDRTRVITVEAWRDAESFRRSPDADGSGALLYAWVGTGGREPTPVDDATAGVIVIDLFRVWRALTRPVSAFNVRNGAAFNREPGCVSPRCCAGSERARSPPTRAGGA